MVPTVFSRTFFVTRPQVINQAAGRKNLFVTRPMIVAWLRLDKVLKGIMHLELNATLKVVISSSRFFRILGK